jgi:hypothetical protein
MRDAVLPWTATSRGVMEFLFGKRSDNDWGSVLMSIVLGGSAGVLLVLAAE